MLENTVATEPSDTLKRLAAMEETDWSKLKMELNTVTIMHGPANVTLKQAEEAMLRYINYLQECAYNNA